jgi:hypothetical protein
MADTAAAGAREADATRSLSNRDTNRDKLLPDPGGLDPISERMGPGGAEPPTSRLSGKHQRARHTRLRQNQRLTHAPARRPTRITRVSRDSPRDSRSVGMLPLRHMRRRQPQPRRYQRPDFQSRAPLFFRLQERLTAVPIFLPHLTPEDFMPYTICSMTPNDVPREPAARGLLPDKTRVSANPIHRLDIPASDVAILADIRATKTDDVHNGDGPKVKGSVS